MYPILLAIHSLIRWLVVISLFVAIVNAFIGWFKNRQFRNKDLAIQRIAVEVAQLQMLIGIILYVISPVVRYFLTHFKEAIKLREIRFFGLEHITMMLTAVILITVGSSVSKKKTNDLEKFKTVAIWYTIAFLIIFSSIPWQFSPLTSRPYFRAFF
ncbi:hypothetical protein DVR12_13020 [Chitinophaga silvatica]|uniref:Uncharacterized protein n=1 Tax=Chitinophaga silvatica TaxID=2282649 RepID=A0A3E1YAG7_9BACT|nr:hypothetical protein [Chitinophaga silvatica]RFS22709.1 hypothetical protein DVR12_13020 [Chitinophaga silvatica]